ncbi:MAG TPA: 3-dehydroquinate synthase, partial [Candidatus Goldiibacteriota bacterium]|nr:3-dehydroquinate synthase [Candidatus Goldiibacteriota bacterium]
MGEIKVRLKEKTYSVHVGTSLIGRVGALMRPLTSGNKVLVVSNNKVFGLYGKRLLDGLKGRFKAAVCLLNDGEKYKTLAAAEKVALSCAQNGLDRKSSVIALGGGVIGDIAGFAAAIYMRGIGYVQVPTTLLAQVDSSVGGKTGVDMKYGKNMLGAFHQPMIVVADVSALSTLNEEEFKNGLSEAIKHGIIMDEPLFRFFENNVRSIAARDKQAMVHIVERSVADKALVVSKDEKESGLRAILNYGHTVGHAIEAAGGYSSIKHGQAIVMGMIIAARMAYKMGVCDVKTVNRQIQMFNLFNLIKPLKNLKISSIIKRLYNDKKAVNGKIRFVLTKKIGCATLIESAEIKRIKEELV